MTFPNSRDCEHGHLRRKCPICERDEEIERLRVDAAYGQILIRYIDRLIDPSPDDSLGKIIDLMAKEVNETMERLRNLADG